MLNMGGSCSVKNKRNMEFNAVKESIFLSLYRGIFKTLKHGLSIRTVSRERGIQAMRFTYVKKYGREEFVKDKGREVKNLLNAQDYFNRYFHSNGQREKGGGSTAMKKQKLNYCFHNPNTAEVTVDYILKVFIEVNAKKVERVMQEVAEKSTEEDKREAK